VFQSVIAATIRFNPLALWRWFLKERSRISPSLLKQTARAMALCVSPLFRPGRLILHLFAALAEFERNLIRERTVAGLKAARALGRNRGRPAKHSAKEIKTTRALLKTADILVAEIATRFGVARSTLYRTIKSPA
jgi:hypothetical protein